VSTPGFFLAIHSRATASKVLAFSAFVASRARLPIVRRMDALLYQRPRLVTLAPRIIKRDMPAALVVEILTDGKNIFLARDAIDHQQHAVDSLPVS
jgi:hypothetical protein